MSLRISNLAGVFTGSGFLRKSGRKPGPEDTGFIRGPLDVLCSECGWIEQIEPFEGARGWNGETVDATGLFATAGFIDSHTHAIFAGERSSEFFQRWNGATYIEIAKKGGGIASTVQATMSVSDKELRRLLEERLIRMLRSGCTSVEVKSGYADSIEKELRLLQVIRQAAVNVNGPEVFPTFLPLHSLAPNRSETELVDEAIASLPEVKRQGLATMVDSFPERGFFFLSSSLRFSRAAARLGFRIKVHADELSSGGTAEAFAEAGALSVDHLQKISSRGIEALSKGETVATLLPATSFYLGIDYADARALLDGGVRVALASDFNPGTAPSIGLQMTNLLAARELKMNAAEILCACTYNAASALGLSQSQGALLPGYLANLALWSTPASGSDQNGADVLEEIVLTCKAPEIVVLKGRSANFPAQAQDAPGRDCAHELDETIHAR
jgi:imidazolonepropionase